MSESFFCPVCQQAVLWADADAAHTGSFCSGACAQAYAARERDPATAPDLQLIAENVSGTYAHGQQDQDDLSIRQLFD